MTDQAFLPLFSGESEMLAAIWHEAVAQSPWVTPDAKGLHIDWPHAFDSLAHLAGYKASEDVLKALEGLAGFVPWDKLVVLPEDRDPQVVFYGLESVTEPLSAKQEMARDEFRQNIINFAEVMQSLIAKKANALAKRSSNFNWEAVKTDQALAALNSLQRFESRNSLKLNQTLFNVYTGHIPRTGWYYHKEYLCLEFILKNRAIMPIVNRVTNLLQRNSSLAKHQFAALFEQLGECASVLVSKRGATRFLFQEHHHLYDGGDWKTSAAHKTLARYLSATRDQTQIFAKVTGDFKVIKMFNMLEESGLLFERSIEISLGKPVYQQASRGQIGWPEMMQRSIEVLFTKTPLVALFHSWIFQFHLKANGAHPVFGYSSIVMIQQCAKKLLGPSFHIHEQDGAIDASDSPESEASTLVQEAADASPQAGDASNGHGADQAPWVAGLKAKTMDLERFSSAGLWAKIYQARNGQP